MCEGDGWGRNGCRSQAGFRTGAGASGMAGGVEGGSESIPIGVKGFSKGSAGGCLRTGRAVSVRDFELARLSALGGVQSSTRIGSVGSCFMGVDVVVLSTNATLVHTKKQTGLITVVTIVQANIACRDRVNLKAVCDTNR